METSVWPHDNTTEQTQKNTDKANATNNTTNNTNNTANTAVKGRARAIPRGSVHIHNNSTNSNHCNHNQKKKENNNNGNEKRKKNIQSDHQQKPVSLITDLEGNNYKSIASVVAFPFTFPFSSTLQCDDSIDITELDDLIVAAREKSMATNDMNVPTAPPASIASGSVSTTSSDIHKIMQQTVVQGHTYSISTKFDLSESRVLGHGSYGVVITAFDKHFNTNVAIKRIRPIDECAEYSRRVLSEVRCMKALKNHPNVSDLASQLKSEEHYMYLFLTDYIHF
jgi:hypothetical protein